MTKPIERARAWELRSEGNSVKDIAKQLGVTRSAVSVWVRDIALTEDQKAALKDKYHHYEAKLKGSQANFQKALKRRLAYQQAGRAKAREGDPLHRSGCLLYWAEGKKRRNALVFVNSDPDMMRFYMRFLRERLMIVDELPGVHVKCYPGNGIDVEDIEEY